MKDENEFSASYDPRSWAQGAAKEPPAGESRSEVSFDPKRWIIAAPPAEPAGEAEEPEVLPSTRRSRIAAGCAGAALLLLGAVAAFVARPDAPAKATLPPPPVPAVRTVTAKQGAAIGDALNKAGIGEQAATAIGEQAAAAVRPGDRDIRMTIDVAARKPSLLRLEAMRPDGSRVRLDGGS